jgi:hypothetical protein
MHQKLSVSVGCALFFAVACSSDTVFSPAPDAINGKWAEDFSIPGSFFEMSLVQTNGSISGTGRTCGEAGPCSNVAVTGTISAALVHLDLVFTQTLPNPSGESTASFDGRLVSPNRLTGTLREPAIATPGGAEFKIGFQREQ